MERRANIGHLRRRIGCRHPCSPASGEDRYGVLPVLAPWSFSGGSRAASWRRELIPSLRYALPRCISTVLTVTNSACAISGLLAPPVASSTIRRSLGVSESAPHESGRRIL